MSHTPDDKTLNEYLEGKSPYSARYRDIPADDVPPELDEAILTRAQAALAEAPAHEQLSRWRRWSVPATLAATFVLVVSLVIKNNVPQAPAENVVTVDLRAPLSSPVPDVVIAIPSDTPAPKLEMPPAQNVDRYSVLERKTQEADAVARQKESSADIAEERAVVAQLAEKAAVANELAKLAETVTEPVKPAPPAAPAPATTSEPAPAARAAPPPAPVIAMNDSAGAAQPFASERRAAQTQSAFKKSAATGEAEAQLRESDPQKWLEHIRELRKNGKQEEAKREWENFRKRYPDFQIEPTDTARTPQR